MAKRYKNESENKYYTMGDCFTRRLPNGGVSWCKPTEEELAEWGYVEVIEPVVEPVTIPIEQQYKDLVISKIRLQYSTDDELAILRQRDSKIDEFAAYNTYCEQCKADAREELGIEEGGA